MNFWLMNHASLRSGTSNWKSKRKPEWAGLIEFLLLLIFPGVPGDQMSANQQRLDGASSDMCFRYDISISLFRLPMEMTGKD